MKAAHNERLFY